jgi:hypothetical protein
MRYNEAKSAVLLYSPKLFVAQGGKAMARNTWLKARKWLIGGITLALLALAAILIIWTIQYHDYQLALAHYNATYKPYILLKLPNGTLPVAQPYLPPSDTSGPAAWGWIGWTIRLLVVLAPLALGFFLDWRERRQVFLRIHHQELGEATNKLAEAITTNRDQSTGVIDAYSKLRDIEARHQRQGPKRS